MVKKEFDRFNRFTRVPNDRKVQAPVMIVQTRRAFTASAFVLAAADAGSYRHDR